MLDSDPFNQLKSDTAGNFIYVRMLRKIIKGTKTKKDKDEWFNIPGLKMKGSPWSSKSSLAIDEDEDENDEDEDKNDEDEDDDDDEGDVRWCAHGHDHHHHHCHHCSVPLSLLSQAKLTCSFQLYQLAGAFSTR